MVKPRHQMSAVEWRLDTDSRILDLEYHKAIQTKVWWGVAVSIGAFLLPRFLDFFLRGITAIGGTPL